MFINIFQLSPLSIDSPIASKYPFSFTSGESKSSWASKYTNPKSLMPSPATATALDVQFPARIRGKLWEARAGGRDGGGNAAQDLEAATELSLELVNVGDLNNFYGDSETLKLGHDAKRQDAVGSIAYAVVVADTHVIG